MTTSRASARNTHGLALRAVLLLGLLTFGLFLTQRAGWLQQGLASDRSYISYVIAGLYVLATVDWLRLAWRLSADRDRLQSLERLHRADELSRLRRHEGAVGIDTAWPESPLSEHLGHVLHKRERGRLHGDQTLLLDSLGERLANRHGTGHFVADVLLKLGLLGTMVGFIFMLRPVADLTEAGAAQARELLQAMSSGMAVALYTTIAGLVTSTLLRLQYQLLDSAGQDLIRRAAVILDALVAESATSSEA
ncbi:MAG: MotA/TolQ/ExbB proton channel family protein [Acidobacteriota bacterium]